jgi:hypothetical protein
MVSISVFKRSDRNLLVGGDHPHRDMDVPARPELMRIRRGSGWV